MQYRITKISPLKAALSLTAIKLIMVLVVFAFGIIVEISDPAMIYQKTAEQNPSILENAFPALFTNTILTFVAIFLGCLLFNKINHLWGGLEITLIEQKHSNNQINRTENTSVQN